MKIESSDALVVVDVQNDFCPGGALPVSGGHDIVPVINRLIPLFRRHACTRDWHPANHCSFSATPRFVDGSWPAHCLQNTPGAEFHPLLHVPKEAIIVSKAIAPHREAYSDFDGTSFADDLRKLGVTRLFVCGLATDYCVKATAMDGVKLGFRVLLIEDACRGVDIPPGSAAQAVEEMKQVCVEVVHSEELG